MPEHDRAADTSRAPDERIDPRRSRRSICMTNEIDVALPHSDHDRACRVRRHGAVHGVHRTHALVARPVSVVAAIAPRRRRCRFPIKNSHAKYQRGLPASRLRHTPETTSAPHRHFRRRNVDGLPRRACPARNPRETGFLHRMDVTRIDTVACNRFSCCLAIANARSGGPFNKAAEFVRATMAMPRDRCHAAFLHSHGTDTRRFFKRKPQLTRTYHATPIPSGVPPVL
ncbi:hypothetical protein [Burkholderia pyrrocinia]|uniref:hypothetical protein n=1 Tax=Burkholderia pyrrocinia TaxID=60550 RepID=UPI00158DC6EC|nr:hypothetical protein [Burkholderia pyrrocinia]